MSLVADSEGPQKPDVPENASDDRLRIPGARSSGDPSRKVLQSDVPSPENPDQASIVQTMGDWSYENPEWLQLFEEDLCDELPPSHKMTWVEHPVVDPKEKTHDMMEESRRRVSPIFHLPQKEPRDQTQSKPTDRLFFFLHPKIRLVKFAVSRRPRELRAGTAGYTRRPYLSTTIFWWCCIVGSQSSQWGEGISFTVSLRSRDAGSSFSQDSILHHEEQHCAGKDESICKSSCRQIRNEVLFVQMILWDLLVLVKIYVGIMIDQSHTDVKSTEWSQTQSRDREGETSTLL